MSAEDDRSALIAHPRKEHPNLLSATDEPLPADGDLDAAPIGLLRAVHEANHLPLYRRHNCDDWLTRS